jgi:hypothetical protein
MESVIDKLKSFGNNERIPLPDAFPYTDGITYSFGTGKYFSCRNETDPGTTIFNSHGKKLGRTGRDRVALQIKGCIATSSESTEASAWCERRATKYAARGIQEFNTLKLWAALHAISKGVCITENCGIFPIFKYPIPSKDDKNYDTSWKKTREIVRYAIEMKVDRDKIIEAKELRIKSLAKEVKTMEYVPTESEKKVDKLTEKQRKIILNNYSIQNTDGEMCNKKSGCVITTKRPTLHGIDIDGTPIEMNVQRHRAYMFTFEGDERRIHQTEVDHIDGNSSNNVPWNYRWASRIENLLAKHNERKEPVVQDDAELLAIYKEPSDPNVWIEGGMTLHSNMWISRPNEPRFIKIAEDDTYPLIGVTIADSDGTMRKRQIPVHMAITYKFIERIEITDGALANLKLAGESSEYFSTKYKSSLYFSTKYISPTSSFSEFSDDLKKFNLYILHGDNEKSNYRVENLRIGTPSENAIDRQDNPKTTLRICVDLFEVSADDVVKEPLPFDSYTKAAAYLEVTRVAVSNTARFNRTCGVEKRRKMTNPTTGVKYHVVERDI